MEFLFLFFPLTFSTFDNLSVFYLKSIVMDSEQVGKAVFVI